MQLQRIALHALLQTATQLPAKHQKARTGTCHTTSIAGRTTHPYCKAMLASRDAAESC
jgi:hypothetical protein